MPKHPFLVLFGGTVAYILLLLYSGSVGYMIWKVKDWTAAADTSSLAFHDGLLYVVTTIGGLVSALVVSHLAVTTPGDNPAVMRVAVRQDGTQSGAITSVVMIYLVVWLVVGLAALIVGVLWKPTASQTLSDIGTTWLGLAVASGYAYLGIDPGSRSTPKLEE